MVLLLSVFLASSFFEKEDVILLGGAPRPPILGPSRAQGYPLALEGPATQDCGGGRGFIV